MRKKKTIIASLKSNPDFINNISLLAQHYHNNFCIYSSVEELIYKSIDDYGERKVKSFEKLFSTIHWTIILEFRKDDIFLSSSALYEVIYYEWKNDANNFLLKVIDNIFVYGLNADCYILVPLIKFGLNKAGIKLFFLGDLNISFITDSAVFYPQTNNKEKTIENIVNAIKIQGDKRVKLDTRAIEHYLLSRPLKWFSSNPLAIIKIKSSFHDYHENEYIILRLFEKEITKLVILSMFQISNDIDKKSYDFSTRIINNFHTKDIKHYLFFHKTKNKFSCTSIPIHENHGLFQDIMNTDINLNITKGKNNLRIKKIWSFIDTIYKTHLTKSKDENHIRFIERIISSLEFLRRSISQHSNVDKWIFYGSSLELLLSEGVEGQITETICLNGAFCVIKNQDYIYNSLKEIYDCRSRAIHEGIGIDKSIENYYNIYLEIFYSLSQLYLNNNFTLSEKRPINSYIKMDFPRKSGHSVKLRTDIKFKGVTDEYEKKIRQAV